MRAYDKYVVYPGIVQSKFDGEIHYISADQLMRLYGVAPHECIVVHLDTPQGSKGYNLKDLISLSPQYSGDYSLDKQ